MEFRNTIGIVNPSVSPEPLVDGILQVNRDQHGAAERARSLLVADPAVEATPVEHMAAVGREADLILRLELVEAHGASVWLFRAGQGWEAGNCQGLPGQRCWEGVGRELKVGQVSGAVSGGGGASFQEAEGAGDSGGEAPEEGEEGE